VEAEWLIATCDRAPSHDGGSMWFILAIGLWLYVRPGGATRGKWGIPDGKVKSGMLLYSELRSW
jgi:hypothetical protein